MDCGGLGNRGELRRTVANRGGSPPPRTEAWRSGAVHGANRTVGVAHGSVCERTAPRGSRFEPWSTLAKGYTLVDTGASHKFVRPAFLEKLTNENIKFTSRRYGTMRQTTAGNIETLPCHQAKLTLAMGNPHGTCFWYTGWFTVYDLVNYDIILGKDWHEQVKHTIDYKQNILTITKDMSELRRPGRDVSLRGLARDQRAEEVELFIVVETAYGVIDCEPNKNACNPPMVTACGDLHSGKRTQVVSKATHQLASLPPPADVSTISELFATSINNQTTNKQIANNQTAMNAKIRAEYRELFQELTGLPPRRLRFGDFKIRLLPGSVAPY